MNSGKPIWTFFGDGRKVCYLNHNGKRLGVRVLSKDMEATTAEFLRVLCAMMDIANKEA